MNSTNLPIANSVKIYPVIHYLDRITAIDQVGVARQAGAHGVFLISHHCNDGELVNVAWEAKQVHANFPIGINLLSVQPETAVKHAQSAGLDMVWADDMGVDSKGLTVTGQALSNFAKDNPEILLFASVAFKYRPDEADPAMAAKNALAAGFIPTTSGAATGRAPEVAKIAAMSAATGGNLAVASGMTPENVSSYAPYLSHILVATGVALDEYSIDPEKLKRLIAVCPVKS